jgi:hypothetical protein
MTLTVNRDGESVLKQEKIRKKKKKMRRQSLNFLNIELAKTPNPEPSNTKSRYKGPR